MIRNIFSRAEHPVWRRCSSVTNPQFAPSSRLASRAPRHELIPPISDALQLEIQSLELLEHLGDPRANLVALRPEALRLGALTLGVLAVPPLGDTLARAVGDVPRHTALLELAVSAVIALAVLYHVYLFA